MHKFGHMMEFFKINKKKRLEKFQLANIFGGKNMLLVRGNFPYIGPPAIS
jgi:hypothetical protein